MQRGLSALPLVQRWTCLDRHKFGPSAPKTNISDTCRKIRGGQQETGMWGAERTSAAPRLRTKAQTQPGGAVSPSAPLRRAPTSDLVTIRDTDRGSFAAF